MNGHGDGSNGTPRKGVKVTKRRSPGAATKAQQEARRRFIAESPVKPTREGMDAVRRELLDE